MPKLARAAIRVFSDGDAESAYASGPVEFTRASEWFTSGVNEGGIDSGSGTTLRFPAGDGISNRCVLAIDCSGLTVKVDIDPNFGWAGGVPALTVDLDDIGGPPVSSSNAAAIKVSDIWVTTTKLASGKCVVANPTSGRWYYIEGEPELEFHILDPDAED